jgi:hypothetical protein
MKKKTLHTIVVSASILPAVLVFSLVAFNWHGKPVYIADIAEAKKVVMEYLVAKLKH